MRFLLLLFAGLAVGVSGQQCYSSNCAICLSDPQCYYYVSCGQCTSSGGGTCGGKSPTRYASDCPADAVEAARPLSSAYWTLSIAFVAAGGMVALMFSPLERLCGQKQSSLPAHRGFRFGCSIYLLLLACWCLWFGFSLALSAPALPWLVAASAQQTTAATAFSFTGCFYSSDGTELCQSFRTLEYMSASSNSAGGSGLSDADFQYAEQGFALGVVGYIAGIGLLLPCVLMASLAAYRLRRFEVTGIAPYTSGCSPVSLAVAQMLGWPAFVIITIVTAFATGLCSDVAAQLNKYSGLGAKAEYLFMPGPLAAGLGITLQLFGLILLAVVSRSLSSVHGVGCNRGGCCFKPASDDDPAAPSQDVAPLIYTRPPAAPSSYNKQPMNAAVPMLSVGSA
jgi:hypothetical protein